jgi:hypothetical protein
VPALIIFRDGAHRAHLTDLSQINRQGKSPGSGIALIGRGDDLQP